MFCLAEADSRTKHLQGFGNAYFILFLRSRWLPFCVALSHSYSSIPVGLGLPRADARVVRTHCGSDVTRLLRQMRGGDRQAFDELASLVYEQLRRVAHARLRTERSDHTLNTTALVHEAYLDLIDVDQAGWRDQAHFLAAASRVMRHILVDYARIRNAHKRGRGWVRVDLDEALQLSGEYATAVEELHDALTRLEALSPRQSQLLEQRYFGGLKLEECAEVLGVSLSTVQKELRRARAWLACELNPEFVAQASKNAAGIADSSMSRSA